MQPRAGIYDEGQVGQLFGSKYVLPWLRTAKDCGLLIVLTSKMLFSASVRGITLSSALMLWVAESASREHLSC